MHVLVAIRVPGIVGSVVIMGVAVGGAVMVMDIVRGGIIDDKVVVDVSIGNDNTIQR